MRVNVFVGLGLAAMTVAAGAEPPIALPASTHNYTVRITLNSLSIQPDYGEEDAPVGTRFLVFAVTWEDLIDPVCAKERNLPAGAKDDDLSETLSLVIDDSVVVPVMSHEAGTAGLDANDPDIVGHSGGSTDSAYLRKAVGLKNAAGRRSLVYYAMDRPGAKAGGDLLFAVPTAPWHRLELRYHDPIGGDCSLLLAGSPAAAAGGGGAAVADPPGAKTNEVFALAARLSEDPATGLPVPPPGRRYVAVDFQGRSVLRAQDQYPPYDPTHPAGAVFWRPDPAGWGDLNDDLQMVADGRYCGVLDAASDVFEHVQFVPRVWTHHRLVFLVPAAARSLDLECFFNDYTIPGHDENITPKPAHFHLGGPSVGPPPVPAAPEKRIVDGPMVDDVLKHLTAARFSDAEAGPDERFLVLDLMVRNTGAEEAEFHAVEQIVWFNQGDEVAPDEATSRGPLAPPPYLKLAAGEARAFQVAWRIPAGLKRADLGLKGNAVAEKFSLTLSTR